MFDRRPILVTGSHRSGSTWVGHTLARAPGVAYVHEPFNLNTRPGVCGARFRRQFTYVTRENAPYYHPHLKRALGRRYGLRAELGAVRTPRDVARMGRDFLRVTRDRLMYERPLMKDPIALFSAEWLARTFDMRVVVLIRHPAAFISSIKRLGWKHPFHHFLEQPRLMEEHLDPYRDEIERLAHHDADVIAHGILLWKLTSHMIAGFRARHPEWLFRRHEDLSRAPVGGFRELYRLLDLRFTDEIRDRIRRTSAASNPREPASPWDLTRDSAANIRNWRQRLTRDEIARIREGLDGHWQRYYAERDWS